MFETNNSLDLVTLKNMVSEIITKATSDGAKDTQKDISYWNIYNCQTDSKRFKYLTNVDGLTYPSVFRNIGEQLVHSKLQLLESKQARREFRFKAIASDERSLKQKLEDRVKSYLKTTSQMYDDRIEFIKMQISVIDQKMQDINSQLQIQPENEQMQAQQQQLKQNYPMIKYEMDKMIRSLSQQSLDAEEFKKKLEFNLQFTESQIIEQIANASIKSAIQQNELIDHWFSGFKEKNVTGRPTYLTYFNTRTNKTVFECIDAKDVFYSKGGGNKWTQEGEYVVYRRNKDYNQICAEFELTTAEREILKHKFNGEYIQLKNYAGDSAIFDNDSSRSFDSTEVWYVWMNVPRNVYFKKSPNKKRIDDYFYNVTDEDSKLKSGEERKRITLYDQYHCVVIGGIVFINYGKNNAVFRHNDYPALPLLPIVAKTFGAISDKPNSLISRVVDLIDLYNIVNYKEEMTLALAGVKGMIMDKSQKPEDMSVNKWIYYRRMGTMWIETMKKGRKVPASFNQFQSYDDGLSQSVQFYEVIKQNIEMLISKILGITPSAEGQFVSKDPVSNVKMSTEQSALITEINFYENDKVFSKALELFLNLKCQYEWNKGMVINNIDKDLEEVLISIPDGLLNKSNFRIYTNNNIKEDSLLEDVRNIAIQSWSRMELPLNSLISLFSIDNLQLMEQKLIKYSNEAQELKQRNAMAIDNNKAAADQQTNELKAKLDMEIKQSDSVLKEAELQLKKLQFEFDQQKFMTEQQFKERELQVKANTEMLKISSENDIESAYLQEEGRSNRVQEMLQSFELKINSMLQQMGIEAGDIANIRKTKVDEKKNMRNKENIKD